MKRKKLKIISVIICLIMSLTLSGASLVVHADAQQSDLIILYTNDVHCSIEDYPMLAAYRAELIAQGNRVITVDAGDAIQGEVIGTMTDGLAVVDIMNAVGYDYAVPGNHEFDYGMETFLDLANNEAEYEYIASNFHYLPGVRPVFKPYSIAEFNGKKIAFVGISTPETVTKANPEYFKDENRNFIYGFPTWDMAEGVLAQNIQESVDSAVNEGADVVVAVGHLGIQGVTEGWRSTDIIGETGGIDVFIDAHSHEEIIGNTYKNKDDEDVLLTSSGTKFNYIGQVTLYSDGSVVSELIDTDDLQLDSMSSAAKEQYDSVKAVVDGYNEEIAYLYDPIGTSEAKLVVYDEENNWLVRKAQTNTGDFVTDAYRAVTGADIAVCNGGGIRSEIDIGDVNRKSIMNINPWSNEMCVIEITGQQLVDMLEHSARSYPEYSGGFMHVSGMSYQIDAWKPSPVSADQFGNFESINEDMERRVTNVKVGGEPVDLSKMYTVAGSCYVLIDGGDGMTMIDGANVISREALCDSDMLIKYFTEDLQGKITASQYGNPAGDGRITILATKPVPNTDTGIGGSSENYGGNATTNGNAATTDENAVTTDENAVADDPLSAVVVIIAVSAVAVAGGVFVVAWVLIKRKDHKLQ